MLNVNQADLRSAGGALQIDLAKVAGINALAFHQESVDGANIRPALLRAIAKIKAGAPRTLIIPYRVGGWTVSSQVLFDLSNFNLVLLGDVSLTATTRQMTFLFAYDTNQQPAQALQNVAVYGNGRVIDGNATAMTFSYGHGDGSDNTSSVRFNYVYNVYVERLHAKNGPIDSFSCRQVNNGLVRKCTFSTSKEDNGASATTDMPGYTYGQPDTYGSVTFEDCVAFDNEDFGMTAFNASGVRFVRCVSYRNRAPFSYEDAFATPNIKTYDGGFYGCTGYDGTDQGFYITADGVTIDDNCKSYNIRGYGGLDPDGLFGHGVVIANARRVYVGGEHTKNARAGVAIFNGTTHPLDIVVGAKANDNDGPGLIARGVDRLTILPKAEFMRNGLILVDGVYNRGIEVSNSGGSTYLQDTGFVKIDGPTVGGNGLSGIKVQYVKEVNIRNVLGAENCQMAAANGIEVGFATRARCYDNHLPNSHVPNNQTFCVAILSSVNRGYDRGNTGDALTGVVANSATTFAQGNKDSLTASITWTPGLVTPASPVVVSLTVPGADLGDHPICTYPNANGGNFHVYGEVTGSGANNVNVYIRNLSAGSLTPTPGTLRVLVIKRNPG